MELYELMSWRWSVPISYDIKIDLNGTYILRYGVSPQGFDFILVKCHDFLQWIWTLYPKLLSLLDILLRTALLHLRDNYVSYPQHVIFPPVERRLMINILQDCLLHGFNQISLVQIQQLIPGSAIILTEEIYPLSSSWRFLARFPICRQLLILQR